MDLQTRRECVQATERPPPPENKTGRPFLDQVVAEYEGRKGPERVPEKVTQPG